MMMNSLIPVIVIIKLFSVSRTCELCGLQLNTHNKIIIIITPSTHHVDCEDEARAAGVFQFFMKTKFKLHLLKYL